MGRRSSMKITVRDIARLAGVGYRTVLADEHRKRWSYGDIESVFNYIKDRRDGKETNKG